MRLSHPQVGSYSPKIHATNLFHPLSECEDSELKQAVDENDDDDDDDDHVLNKDGIFNRKETTEKEKSPSVLTEASPIPANAVHSPIIDDDVITPSPSQTDLQPPISVVVSPVTKPSPVTPCADSVTLDLESEKRSETKNIHEEEDDSTWNIHEYVIEDREPNKERRVEFNLPTDHSVSKELLPDFSSPDAVRTIVFNSFSHSEDDARCAQLLSLPVTLNGVNAGFALIDQGATRSLVRRSHIVKSQLNYTQIAVHNHSVMSSSGKLIPVLYKCHMDIRVGDVGYGQSSFYIIEDDSYVDADICCDIVIGRSTMAKSEFPLIDTRSGRLYSRDGERMLKTVPVSIVRINPHGPLTLKPIDSKLNTGNRNENKSTKLSESLKGLKSRDHKLNRLNVLVANRIDLSRSQREMLMTHLVNHIDDIDIPVTGKHFHNEYLIYHSSNNEKSNINSNVSDLLSYLPYTNKGSDEEKGIVDALFTTYIPGVLKKEAHKEKARSEDHGDDINGDDETIKTVEDIEFPFTQPPALNKELSDEQYLIEKKIMMKDLVYKNQNINNEEKKLLLNLLWKYEECFSMHGEKLKQTNVAMHEIDTGSTQPFRERLRPYSPPMQAIIDREVDKMIKMGILVPSKSPYASNLLLVRKPDPSEPDGWKNRVCASFVRLNKLTEKDSYPLPNIQTIFDSIGRSKWFTTMDLLSGFWQVMIKPEHRHKTAVITSRGLYEYMVMAFGLCNAPATFQRLMDAVVLPEYREFIQTYIDDVLTHSHSFTDHIKHLDTTLSLFKKNKLMVKLSKCKFVQTEVKFLGHIISHGAMRCNPESVETIRNWKRPSSGKNQVTAVRSFLGMVGWYRKFIPNFSIIAEPLFHLTKKNIKWEWTPQCEKAFRELIRLITKGPVLAIADPNKPYILHTDASDVGMGAVLMQEDKEGDIHPIAYASKLLNSAQRNYNVTDRECLAMVWALEHFNTYVEGHKYTFITDHNALQYLRNTTHTKQRMHRLALKLQPYEIEVEYRPGVTHYAADLLSRESTHMDSHRVSNHTQQQSSTASHDHMNALSVRKKARKRKTLEKEYVVEKIVNKRQVQGRENDYEYEVKWQGYEDEDNTWEPLEHLSNSIDLVVQYESSLLPKSASGGDKVMKKLLDGVKKTVDDGIIPPVINNIHDTECEKCQRRMNNIQRYLHNYYDHHVPIPTPSIHADMITADSGMLKALQEKEKDFSFIYKTELGMLDELPDHVHLSSKEVKALNRHEFVKDKDGILYCIEIASVNSKPSSRTAFRLCVPKSLRRAAMKYTHESVLSNHPGIIHMFDSMRQYVWWPSMISDIAHYVNTCEVCLKNKRVVHRIPVQPMSLPTEPWSHVAFDIIGPLPKTATGNEYILTAIDRFTRMTEAMALPTCDTFAIATAIFEMVICRHGLFEVMQSDRGSGFVSIIAANIYKIMGIKQVKTTAYHPRSNGVIERFNKTLKQTLKIYCNEHQNDWDVFLPYALFAYNTSYHHIIKETPFYLNYGRDPKTILHQTLGIRPNAENNRDVHAYAVGLAQKLHDVHSRVLEIYKEVNERRMNDDDHYKVPSFNVGDKIYLYKPSTETGYNAKLTRRWKGPYTVLQKISHVVYRIDIDGTAKDVSVERMRKLEQHKDETLEGYDSDLITANVELECISQSMAELLERQKRLEEEKNKLEASKQLEIQEAQQQINVNSICVIVQDVNLHCDL
jgi:hypothetical protein